MQTKGLVKTVALLCCLGGLIYFLAPMLRMDRLLEQYGAAAAYVRAHLGLSLMIYFLSYVVVVVLALPAALAMTLLGGALFGGVLGGLTTVLAATLGATVIFLAARGLLHDYFVRKTEPWLGRLRREFQADAASYMLMLRLTPVFPFTVVNLAAGLFGARASTYIWTTFLGIIPGTAAYSYVGAGLSGLLEAEATRLAACRQLGTAPCSSSFDPASFVSRDIAIGLAGLGLLVLISLVARKYRARMAPAAAGSGLSATERPEP